MHRGVPRMLPGVYDLRGRRAASDPPPITKPDDRLFRSSAEVRREGLSLSRGPAGGAGFPRRRGGFAGGSRSRWFSFVGSFPTRGGADGLGGAPPPGLAP